METGRKKRKISIILEQLLSWLDKAPLWLLGFLILAVNLLPCLILGKGSVFPIHDQLDETILSYVLNAKYLGTDTKIFSELLGGINASGMQPSAVLFVPLYKVMPAFAAFLTQWCIVLLSGFLGMYFCVKEMTESSILAVVSGGVFCMLPHLPVYGLSVVGVPLLLCCFLWLYRRKHIPLSFILIAYFGLSTHLVLTGFAVWGLWFLALVVIEIRKYKISVGKKELWLGFCWLTGIYLAVNHSLFFELILGESDYISHREELVNQPMKFWDTVWSVFCNSAQHAESLHRHMIIPILVMLVIGGVMYHRMGDESKARYLAAVAGISILFLIAVFYGLCKWQPVVDFKNSQSGFLRYFQAERFYWLYPAGWFMEFSLCFSLWWKVKYQRKYLFFTSSVIKLLVLGIVLYPTLQEVKINSYLYMNVNQINNGSGITGYISWESYFAEDLMQDLEDAIGRDMCTYRVAHLGVSPAPALMHGFYTVDGYSNNYPLEYKHRFREIIAKELEKNEATRLYFDEWGSRCYLFNGTTGNYWMAGKSQHIEYEELEFDMEALATMGCEYLFSCGEIKNAEDLGLVCKGYFVTDSSYWGIWLYEL